MIIITAEKHIPKETAWINALFDEGLEILHVRKPYWNSTALYRFFEAIKPQHLAKTSIHQHHHLADCYGLNRLHFTEQCRKNTPPNKNHVNSTGTHSIADFNQLPAVFSYAFLSPVYASISKPGYQPQKDLTNELALRKNHHTKLVALGGITAQNISPTLAIGFNDVALLGAVWHSENPVKYFQKCQQSARLY